MIDLKSMSFGDLYLLSIQVSWEMFSRSWWIMLIVFAACIAFFLFIKDR